MSVERWRPVVDFEDLYEISDRGTARSLDHVDSIGRHRKGKSLRPNVLHKGHLRVTLYRDRWRTQRMVHHLVLEAFVGPRPLGMVCCHGPGGPADNRVGNLCWGTQSKNIGEDMRRDGTALAGERNGRARLTESQVRAIRARWREGGVKQRELAREFGIGKSQIHNITSGANWTAA
jgi:hypothetical protein